MTYICSLIPPRIAHRPGVVLEVVTADDSQGDSTSMEVSSNNTHAVNEISASASSSNDTVALTRDVASLRLKGTDDSSQALIVGPGELSSESGPKQTPTSIGSPLQLGTWNNMSQPENLHPFQLQMEELVGRIQRTDQKVDELVGSIQQTDQKMEEVLTRTQHTDQQRTHATNTRPDRSDPTNLATNESTAC
jgi:hypothetical protein